MSARSSGISRSTLLESFRTTRALRDHWFLRIQSELDYAEALAALNPRKKAWPGLIGQARAAVAEAAGSNSPADLEQAVLAAEDTLSPIGQAAKGLTVHCVGHAHIDMNWQWSWPETVAVTNDTFRTVLTLMDEFDDFCFLQSQISCYEIIRKYNPTLWEPIRQRVAEGRWEIAAAHWVEGDKNLPTGEAMARHMLYARQYCREHFGLEAEELPLDWEPDTFGHAATIPTILARGGVRRYYLCRGGLGQKPPVFWWQGPDGSRVLVNLSTAWYNSAIGPENAISALRFHEATGLDDWLCVYGIGDHGGGPTRRDLLWLREMNNWPIFPTFRMATTGAYYDTLEQAGETLPVVEGELNTEFTGCYTSQSDIKKTNRFGEQYCAQAEVLSTLAWRATGRSYPTNDLRDAWVRILFGHFHDILPGSGVRGTRHWQMGQFQESAAFTSLCRTEAMRSIAAKIDTRFAPGGPALPEPARAYTGFGGGVGRNTDFGGISSAGHITHAGGAVVVFNDTPSPRSETVQVTLWDPLSGMADAQREEVHYVSVTPDGKESPAQVMDGGTYWGHEYVELAFEVDVPATGYACCSIQPRVKPYYLSRWANYSFGESKVLPEPFADRQPGAWLDGGHRDSPQHALGPGAALENEHLRAEFDPVTGGVVSLVDKSTGKDLATPDQPMGVLEYVLERPWGMSSWVIRDPIHQQCPLELKGFHPTHRGPNVVALRAEGELDDSKFTVDYILRAGQPWLEMDIRVEWLHRGSRETGVPTLRAVFPTALDDAGGQYESPFGSIDRPHTDGRELPTQRWTQVLGKASPQARSRSGLVVLNDCKYGCSLDDATLRMTLLRSSFQPDPLPEIGSHTMRLGLYPRGKAATPAEAMRIAAQFSQPLDAVSTDAHDGALPPAAATVETAASGVVLTALKKAEEDDAVILRFCETAGRAATAKAKLHPTLLGAPAKAEEVDLLERPTKKNSAAITGPNVSVRVQAHGIATVKVKLK